MVGSIDDVHVPFVSVSDIMAMALEVVVSQYFENHKCAKSTCSSIINFHKIDLNMYCPFILRTQLRDPQFNQNHDNFQ